MSTLVAQRQPQQLDFQALFQSLSAPAAVLDANFDFLNVNAAFECRFECQRDEVEGTSFLRTFASDLADIAQENSDLLLAMERAKSVAEQKFVTRAGQAFDVLFQVTSFESHGHR